MRSGGRLPSRLAHQLGDPLVVAGLGVGDVIGQGDLVLDID